MKKLFLFFLVISAIGSSHFFSSCKSSSNLNDSTLSVSFNKMLDNYYEDHLKLYPLEATAIGDTRYNDLLPADFTDSYRKKIRAHYSAYLDSLAQYNRELLPQNDRISFDILRYELTTDSAGLKFHNNYFPFDQFNGTHIAMGQLGKGSGNQPFQSQKNYWDWQKRMQAFSAWTDSAIAYFRKGMNSDEVLPKALVKKMIPECRDMVVANPEQSLFWGPIAMIPDSFPKSVKEKIIVQYKITIAQNIIPSYKKLADFLEKEYYTAARESSGLNGIPDGNEYYKWCAKYWTTTSLTPDSIYHLGLQQVSMLRTEMEKVKDATGFKGDLQAFFHFLRTDKQFTPFKTDSEVIRAFRAINDLVQPQMKNYFHHFPKSKFVIRETEKFRAASSSIEYLQGTADGSRPGVFYVPIVDATKFNMTDGMTSTFLHEAIPGHHYQVSLQQENTLLPRFRRYAWYGAYGEGWAHYAETLGYELKVYGDPYQHFGALSDQMLRAIRLVVDVGLHTGKLSREEAIQYMTENESVSIADATSEIERYMAYPGQALGYKVGSLTIKSLREKYEKQIEAKFELAAFHDEILANGCMPLAVLDKVMEEWAKNFEQ